MEISQCHRCDMPVSREPDKVISKGNIGFAWTAPTGDVVLIYCQPCFIDMARWVAKQSLESPNG